MIIRLLFLILSFNVDATGTELSAPEQKRVAALAARIKTVDGGPKDIAELESYLSKGSAQSKRQVCRALRHEKIFKRPDFQDLIAQLRKISVQHSKAPDLDVRHCMGDLSQQIQWWEVHDSPKALSDKRWHAAVEAREMQQYLSLFALAAFISYLCWQYGEKSAFY